MSKLANKILLPVIISSLVLGGITVFCLLNKSSWPIILPLGLVLGIVGIVIGNRSNALNPELEKTRVRVVLGTLLISIIIYLVAGIFASLQEGSDLPVLAVIALLPILFPLYYGLAQLLAAALVPNHAS